jgi:hypothetical protein
MNLLLKPLYLSPLEHFAWKKLAWNPIKELASKNHDLKIASLAQAGCSSSLLAPQTHMKPWGLGLVLVVVPQ